MVKKIAKYSKFVLCIALILSLVAPSYAALSASDGSAFVTKAEFDSALADFNARLTTFEAGINSKIDSQVTSYLDRNGIWNGKRQVSSSYITPIRFDFKDLYSHPTANISIIANKLSTSPVGVGYGSANYKYAYLLKNDPGYVVKTFVSNVDKSGLFTGVFAGRVDASGALSHWTGSYFNADGFWSKKFFEMPASQQTFTNFLAVKYTGSTGYGAPGINGTDASKMNGWHPWVFVGELRIRDQINNIKWSTFCWEIPGGAMLWGDDATTAGRNPVPFNRDAHLFLPQFFVRQGDQLFMEWSAAVSGRDSEEKFVLYCSEEASSPSSAGGDNPISYYVMSNDLQVY